MPVKDDARGVAVGLTVLPDDVEGCVARSRHGKHVHCQMRWVNRLEQAQKRQVELLFGRGPEKPGHVLRLCVLGDNRSKLLIAPPHHRVVDALAHFIHLLMCGM